ncbi:hypothetical protein B1748_26415 [Paenibacillus sp. MY03]|jgi:hypothetical protein|uniref:hypothetical protein n=1 Tax=Paenibacillus sp. MY03 TaxID=302980 RepID=UPI000B3C47CF|nr:hypothetical protein [Paenibacillus sp. MY03]OUS71575.1 hypothetical protein B1748_26415 [Paenibacillus sp. MY03]
MLGSWRWNVGFGIAGVGLTVIFSLGNNPMSVILMRSLYAFVAFFVVAFAARFVLGVILQPPAIPMGPSEEEADDPRGAEMDLRTPDESDDLNQLLKAQLQQGASSSPQPATQPVKEGANEGASSFKPLSPPQLVSTAGKQPEELAKAVRHLTGE